MVNDGHVTIDLIRHCGIVIGLSSGTAVATTSAGVNEPWRVGSGKGREPEVATCVRMAGVERFTRAQRAAGRP